MKILLIKNKSRLAIFILTIALLSLSLPHIINQEHAASSIFPTGTYTDWSWPANAAGYDSFAWNLTISLDPSPAGYFWSHQFEFINGDGGYVGLQSQGIRADGSVGKAAIFSVFNAAIDATPGACKINKTGNFDGYVNKTGTSCIIAYNWTTSRTYQLRVAKISTDSTGTWWKAWVKDTVSKQETLIAQIKVPGTWKKLSSASSMWTENFYPSVTDCNLLKHSSVKFTNLVANGSISPTSHYNHLSSPAGCPGSSTTDISGGVQQDMGNVSGSSTTTNGNNAANNNATTTTTTNGSTTTTTNSNTTTTTTTNAPAGTTSYTNCAYVKVGGPTSPSPACVLNNTSIPPSSYVGKVLQAAWTQFGKPYSEALRCGASSWPSKPNGCSYFDCSSFSGWSWFWGTGGKFKMCGNTCCDFGNCTSPHYTNPNPADPNKYEKHIVTDKAAGLKMLQPGDLVYYGHIISGSLTEVHHVAIFEGNMGKNCHADDCIIESWGPVGETHLLDPARHTDFVGFLRPKIQ